MLPSPLLSLLYNLCPTRWFFMLVDFARTSLCACQIYYPKRGTFWHRSIDQCCWVFVRWKSNCNLTVQNSTPAVSALYAPKCKGSLLLANLQRMTDCDPGECAHFLPWPAQPWPSFTMYRRRSVCVSSLFLMWLILLPYCTFKIESGVTRNMWEMFDNDMTPLCFSAALRCTERCIPTQGRCRCVNSLLK